MKWSDLLLPSPKYATHNLDKKWEGTMSPGILYPIYHRLMIPGDTFRIGIRHLIRSNPTKAPLFSSFKVNTVTVISNVKNYAIALEGYRRNFDWRSVDLPYFNWAFENSELGRPTTDIYPSDVLPRIGIKESSLMDYLGYPRGWFPNPYSYSGSSLRKSALAFLVYYDFYRNYMVNPQVSYFPMFRPNNAVDGQYGRSYVTTSSLSDLDEFFEDIHKFYDGTNVGAVNGDATDKFESLFGRFSFFPAVYREDSKLKNLPSVYHGGLVSTLYDPDMNTQWMSQANFDRMNEARINTQTTTGTSPQTYTSFADIVKASSIWQFLMGEVYGDGTYANHIYSQYGVSVRSDMNIPQIVHVMNSVIGFEDITSQSDTQQNANTENETGSPVGQQYGVGRGYGQSNRFTVRNSDKNLVMLMVFAWITPRVRYATGIHPDSNITRLSDVYVPAFDNYALQPLFQEQYYAIPYADGDYMLPNEDTGQYDKTLYANGGPIASAVRGYQPAFTEYKTDVDTVHGLMKNQLSYWTIVRNFPAMGAGQGESSGFFLDSGYVYDPIIGSYTPEEDALTYNVPFSVENEDNFQAQFKFDITAIRPISKSVLPNVR